jgi:CelD/BcsL family acetyltransferase involved in cellulose biosynthesis
MPDGGRGDFWIETARGEWADLFQRAASTPFQSPEWLIPWWRHLGEGRLHLLAVRHNGALDAFTFTRIIQRPS